MTFILYASSVLPILAGMLLTFPILTQEGRDVGLSSLFGGGGGGSAAFVPRTGDVLTWATAVMSCIVIALAMAVDLLVNSRYAH